MPSLPKIALFSILAFASATFATGCAFPSLAYQKDKAMHENKAKKTVKPKGKSANVKEKIVGRSTLKHASSMNRIRNMQIACEAINGKVINPNEIFSFNTVVGKRTPERGYVEANVLVGREYVMGYGGGICQVSSALYNAILNNPNFQVVERYKHTLKSSYTDNDATVSYGGKDFKFKNLYKCSIKIRAISNGGSVTVELIKQEA